jgi:hypothetical protein
MRNGSSSPPSVLTRERTRGLFALGGVETGWDASASRSSESVSSFARAIDAALPRFALDDEDFLPSPGRFRGMRAASRRAASRRTVPRSAQVER